MSIMACCLTERSEQSTKRLNASTNKQKNLLFLFFALLSPKIRSMTKQFTSMAIFAGLLIGIGGIVYLRVGGIVGAVLFAFGLLSVVMCGAQLYTGKSGFLPVKEMWKLVPMILLNAVGCAFAAWIAYYVSNDTVLTNLQATLDARLNASWHGLIMTSVGTGMIMTLAVYGARQKHYWPLLFGVPVFILCGLPHCVADAFYYAAALFHGKFTLPLPITPCWSCDINAVGCVLSALP
jgi:formate/nitrite transporter FocA (FNT family)